MRSLNRAIKRGHATIHQSDIFGNQLLRRTGRGSFQYLNGTEFPGKPIVPEGWFVPKGVPCSDRQQQRKKPTTIDHVFVLNRRWRETITLGNGEKRRSTMFPKGATVSVRFAKKSVRRIRSGW